MPLPILQNVADLSPRRLSIVLWSRATAKLPMAMIFRIKNDRTMTRAAAFNLSRNVLPECNAQSVGVAVARYQRLSSER